METNLHIVYPETGIEFSQLKKIFTAFEEGCKAFLDTDSEFKEGKVVKVTSGSIWLKVVLPIAQAVLPYFVKFIANKLCNKKGKVEVCVEKEEHGEIIEIIIED
ncbi:MAG: hypothetical protein IJY43_06775 [Clostridia bacterium]|nr:hypothetical protein [Clostridia bacterium]